VQTRAATIDDIENLVPLFLIICTILDQYKLLPIAYGTKLEGNPTPIYLSFG